MKFFTETLYDTRAGILEFHFERAGYPVTTGYNVAVIAGMDTTYNFFMQEKNGRWKMANSSPLPEWIISLEDVLGDSICSHLVKSAKNTRVFPDCL